MVSNSYLKLESASGKTKILIESKSLTSKKFRVKSKGDSGLFVLLAIDDREYRVESWVLQAVIGQKMKIPIPFLVYPGFKLKNALDCQGKRLLLCDNEDGSGKIYYTSRIVRVGPFINQDQVTQYF